MHEATTSFHSKGSLWNECENSVLMTRHYPDLGSADFWLVENLLHTSTFREYTSKELYYFIVQEHKVTFDGFLSLTEKELDQVHTY